MRLERGEKEKERDREKEKELVCPSRRPLLLPSSLSFSLEKKKKKLNSSSGNGPLPLPDRRLRRPRLHPPPRPGHRLPQRRLRGLHRPPPLLRVCRLRRGAEDGGEVRRRGQAGPQRPEGEGEPGRCGDRCPEGGEGREEGGGGSGGGGDDGSAVDVRKGEREVFCSSPFSPAASRKTKNSNERDNQKPKHLICSEKKHLHSAFRNKILGPRFFLSVLARAILLQAVLKENVFFFVRLDNHENLTACFFFFPPFSSLYSTFQR